MLSILLIYFLGLPAVAALTWGALRLFRAQRQRAADRARERWNASAPAWRW